MRSKSIPKYNIFPSLKIFFAFLTVVLFYFAPVVNSSSGNSLVIRRPFKNITQH